MNYCGAIVNDVERLLVLFSAHCADKDTINELLAIVRNRERWKLGHSLFQRIRKRTLHAERIGNNTELAQYLFEEICAKTLYNLSGSPAPFDADSAYWVVPNAVTLGRCLGLTDATVLTYVSL